MAEAVALPGTEMLPGTDLLSTTEAADELGVSRQRVLQMVYGKELAGQRVGRDWVIPRAAIEARRLAVANREDVQLWRAAERKEREASALVDEARDARRAVVHRMRDRGLTVRQIGELLSISPQRVSQLDQREEPPSA